MATYSELYDLRNNQLLRKRASVACLIAAETVSQESAGVTNHANRLIWARRVFANAETESVRMLMLLLAKNKGASTAQIQAIADSTLQTAVDAAVDLFATGA